MKQKYIRTEQESQKVSYKNITQSMGFGMEHCNNIDT